MGARIVEADVDLHLPHLVGAEVANVFRTLVLRREIGPARAEGALLDLAELPATRYPVEPLLPRIWALHDNLTAYDATYVALAEALDAPLLTTDRRMARSSGHNARIEVIA
jgi:predicted nucleic acid-binding protein